MTAVTITNPGLDGVSAVKGGLMISGLFAGEALAKGSAVYIKNDGLVYLAVSTATEATNVAAFAGLVERAYAAGDPVTIFGQGNIFQLSTSLTPGALLYVSATAGSLDSAKIASSDTPKAKCISTTSVVIL